jgi:hypothetical protein
MQAVHKGFRCEARELRDAGLGIKDEFGIHAGLIFILYPVAFIL